MGRVLLEKAEICLYSLGQTHESPVPQYEFSLHEFRDPMKQFPLITGKDPAVQEWICTDPRYPAIRDNVIWLATDILRKQGCKWLSIGFRDHHGRWKSQAVVELIAEELSSRGFNVHVFHRA